MVDIKYSSTQNLEMDACEKKTVYIRTVSGLDSFKTNCHSLSVRNHKDHSSIIIVKHNLFSKLSRSLNDVVNG